MPGRKPLPLNTAGTMRFYYLVDGTWHPHKGPLPKGLRPESWRAMTLYRDSDGKTRQIERSGTSKNDVTRRLNEALRDRGHVSKTGKLAANSRMREAVDLWERKVVRDGAVDTTLENYQRRLRLHVLPALGDLLIRECDVAHLDAFFDALAREGVAAETRRGIRTVVSGILNVAVKQKVITANPVRELDRIKGPSKQAAAAMTIEQLSDFLSKMDADAAAARNDIPDFVRFLFGTGVRFGEALAVRWRECNLSDESITVDGKVIPPQSVLINGNLVVVTGKGVVRHGGKTGSTGTRIVGLPGFLYDLLLVRKPLDSIDEDPVFPSGTLGWKHPSNIQRSVREMRARVGYPGFKTHVGRKTVATVLDDAGQSARQVADQLGHADPNTTLARYMGRGHVNPAAAQALDAAHRRDDNPDPGNVT